MDRYLSPAVLASFDGEEPPVPPAPASEPGLEKRLTQTEVNRILAEDRRKHQPSFSGSKRRSKTCRRRRT